MRFLEGIEIDEWCETRGVVESQLEERAKPSVIFRKTFGQQATPRGQEQEVSALSLAKLEQWDECLLWITEWGVWPSSENWPKYYALRAAEGERRSIEVAPGHLFSSSESSKALAFLQVALENAWNACVLSAMGGLFTGRTLVVSCDEWVEVRSGDGATRKAAV